MSLQPLNIALASARLIPRKYLMTHILAARSKFSLFLIFPAWYLRMEQCIYILLIHLYDSGENTCVLTLSFYIHSARSVRNFLAPWRLFPVWSSTFLWILTCRLLHRLSQLSFIQWTELQTAPGRFFICWWNFSVQASCRSPDYLGWIVPHQIKY